MTIGSIRVRLTMWYSVVLLLGLALFGFGMWWALEQRLIDGVDTRLALRMQGLRSALGAEAEIHDRGQLQQELSEFAGQIPDGALIQLRTSPAPSFCPSRTRPLANPSMGWRSSCGISLPAARSLGKADRSERPPVA